MVVINTLDGAALTRELALNELKHRRAARLATVTQVRP